MCIVTMLETLQAEDFLAKFGGLTVPHENYDAHFYNAEVTVPALPFLHPSQETNEKQKAGWSRVSPEMQESDTND